MQCMSVTYSLNAEQLDELINAVENDAEAAEIAITNYLATDGQRLIKSSIENLIPVSNRQKKHAKTSNPLQHDTYNMSVVIYPKKPFYYLYYVDQAQGTSRGKQPADFMERGLEQVVEPLFNDMLQTFNEVFN